MGALGKCKTKVIFVTHFYGWFGRSGRIYVRVYQQFWNFYYLFLFDGIALISFVSTTGGKKPTRATLGI